MTHASLFSGIGGFDLAAEWMGWENKFHCEWNEFGQRVLKYYWPNAKSYGDITKTDFTIWRGKIDILTGGFPCQPYSQAGKRLGKEDERHLWPEMLRAIREIRPRWIVGENVLGLVSWNGGLVFEEVQADLEAEGYQVQPYILPAAGVNAPHRRDRVWFVAYSNRCNDGRTPGQNESEGSKERLQKRDKVRQPTQSGEIFWNAADALSQRNTSSGESAEAERKGSDRTKGAKERRGGRQRPDGLPGLERDVADTSNEGLQRSQIKRSPESVREGVEQQPARFIRPDWENFPTQSPVHTRNDGFPSQLDGITFPKWRNESIKASGNAIVPQVVYQIFKAIEAYDGR